MVNGELVLDREDSQIGDGDDTLMALNSSEINSQITTAKRYPRSIKRFVNDATEMVQLTEDIATECMYALKRGGKVIEGPSARFAEIIASAWGNCRAGARTIGEDGRFVTSQGCFIDLQHNVAITYETKRRITDKQGHTYADDMIGVTANAACSIALRNAVLKGIPKAFWKPIYDAARATAIGDAKTLTSKRHVMLDYFGKMGVSNEQIFTFLEVEGAEDITLDDLALLKGTATAIKDGDTTIEQSFGEDHGKASKARRSPTTDKLKPADKAPAEAEKPKPAKEPAPLQSQLDEAHGLQREPGDEPAEPIQGARRPKADEPRFSDPNAQDPDEDELDPDLLKVKRQIQAQMTKSGKNELVDFHTGPESRWSEHERALVQKWGDAQDILISNSRGGKAKKPVQQELVS